MISRSEFFINHVLVMAGVFAYTFVMSYGLYWVTDKIIPMRVSKWNEKMGLDASQHGEEYDHSSSEHLPSASEWLNPAVEN